MKYFPLLLIPLLAHIAYTDFRIRKVSLLAVLSVSVLGIFRIFFTLNRQIMPGIVLLNTILLALIMCIVLIYTRIRRKKISQAIGLGDLVVLLIAAISFAPYYYLLFLILSSLLGIIFYFSGNAEKRLSRFIPFAGIMAVLLGFSVILDVFTNYSVYDDSVFLKFFV